MRRLSLLLLVLASLLAACGSLRDVTPTAESQGSLRREPTRVPVPTVDAASILAVAADDPRALGDPNAPVTLIDYSDFE